MWWKGNVAAKTSSSRGWLQNSEHTSVCQPRPPSVPAHCRCPHGTLPSLSNGRTSRP